MNAPYIVLGRRNNITALRTTSKTLAYTRIAPKEAPHGQQEQFDTRFVAHKNEPNQHICDTYNRLHQEFFTLP